MLGAGWIGGRRFLDYPLSNHIPNTSVRIPEVLSPATPSAWKRTVRVGLLLSKWSLASRPV